MEKNILATDQELSLLPREPSINAVLEVIGFIAKFTSVLGKHIEGDPHKNDGLLQFMRSASRRFRDAIRATVPDFRPYERNLSDCAVNDNQGSSFVPTDSSKAIYVEDVIKRADG